MAAHSPARPNPLAGRADPAEAPVAATAAPIRPARLDDIPRIVTLHREAFADKFGGAFGSGRIEQGAAALAATWRRQGAPAMRGMFVAEHAGQVIGTTTLRTWEMGGDDGGAAELAFQQELGLWGAMRSLFVLSLLDHPIARPEGFITDVAVLKPYRRAGVARRLLAHVEEEARLRGKRFLGLYVSYGNRGARTLYEQSGFYEVRTRHSWLTRLFYGQGRWVYMRKDLPVL